MQCLSITKGIKNLIKMVIASLWKYSQAKRGGHKRASSHMRAMSNCVFLDMLHFLSNFHRMLQLWCHTNIVVYLLQCKLGRRYRLGWSTIGLQSARFGLSSSLDIEYSRTPLGVVLKTSANAVIVCVTTIGLACSGCTIGYVGSWKTFIGGSIVSSFVGALSPSSYA